jgi:elongation factor 1 alpha-like protein
LFVVAAQFMFDRTRQPQMSAFFNEENDVAEDESNIKCNQNYSVRDSDACQWPDLSKVDEVRLRSCLEEIRGVIGDSVPEHILIDAVLKNEFNFNKALDAVLSSITSAAEKPVAGEFCIAFCIHHIVEKGSGT